MDAMFNTEFVWLAVVLALVGGVSAVNQWRGTDTSRDIARGARLTLATAILRGMFAIIPFVLLLVVLHVVFTDSTAIFHDLFIGFLLGFLWGFIEGVLISYWRGQQPLRHVAALIGAATFAALTVTLLLPIYVVNARINGVPFDVAPWPFNLAAATVGVGTLAQALISFIYVPRRKRSTPIATPAAEPPPDDDVASYWQPARPRRLASSYAWGVGLSILSPLATFGAITLLYVAYGIILAGDYLFIVYGAPYIFAFIAVVIVFTAPAVWLAQRLAK